MPEMAVRDETFQERSTPTHYVRSWHVQFSAERQAFLKKWTGLRYGMTACLSNLGILAKQQADDVTAHALFRESLVNCKELGENLASVALVLGMLERAARLWGASNGLRERISFPRPAEEVEEYIRDIATARAKLGEQSFTAAWRHRQNLTTDQAITYGLQEDP